MASTLSHPAFEELRQTTKCPFAKGARVISAPDWDPALTFTENVAGQGNALRRFAMDFDEHRLHGFVARVGCEQERPSFDDVRMRFHEYLVALAETDESCSAVLAEDKLALGWQFTYADIRMFLNVFATCYPRKHSKYCEVLDGFFVFFQPERSFDFCGSRSLAIMKHEIRARFAEAGLPYNGAQVDARIEALLYMFPVEPFGEPVKWWP